MLQTLHPTSRWAETLSITPPAVQSEEALLTEAHTRAPPRGCLTLGVSESRSFCRATKGCSGLSPSAGSPGKDSCA